MIREKENTVMKKTICSVLSLLITLSAVFSLAACGEDPSQTGHTQHEYDTKWSSDETYHWHAPLCDDTTELKDKAAHDYDADHVCTVCDYAQKGLGTLTVADVTAWTDVESEFRLVFADASKAEAVTYEYDREKITLNAEKQTVKAAADAVGPVQVKVRSACHKTATFTVTCNTLPAASTPKYTEYAQMLGSGVLVDDNGNATGATVAVSEKTTVLIGDSFFDRRWFWTDFYTDDYNGKDVFLAGISEATTNDWEQYMNTVFTAFGDKAPKNIVIHLGTNNIGTGQSAAETENGLQHFLTLLHKKFPQTNLYYFAITSRWDDDGSHNKVINSVNTQTKTWCRDKDWVRYIDTGWMITKDKLNPNHGGSYIHPLLETYSIFTEQLQKAGCVIEEKA